MSIQLAYLTQNSQFDAILQGVIGLLEIVFPGRIRAYYLTGSLTNGTAVYGSDIDVIIVFKDELPDDVAERCHQVGLLTTLISSIRVDLAARSEAELLQVGATGVKLSTQLLYGEDIRDHIPFEPLEQFRHHIIRGFVFYIKELRGTPDSLIYPLAYPDTSDLFFGYTRRGIWHGNRRHEPGTRLLLNAVTLGATLRVLLASGIRCSSKMEAILRYQELIADDWTDWLMALFKQCKLKWGHRVPEDPAGQSHLRELLQHALVFENDVLRCCRPFLDESISVIFKEEAT
ncbi:MAG TPA: nucleotidyltransferase domain-containing protein [Anaerolineae bacterium]